MTLPTISIEGRVVGDPELRFTPSGMAICKLRVVASSRKKEGDNWVDDKTLWLNISCFKKVAENVAESIQDKDLIVATGTLSTHEWEHEGQKRSQIEMAANVIGPSLAFAPRAHGARAARSSESSSSGDQWSAPPVSESSGEPPF